MQRRSRKLIASIALASVAFVGAARGDEVNVTNDAELVRALRSAKAGTTIVVAPGRYRGGIAVNSLHGTREAPIAVRGEDPENPPVIADGNSGLQASSPRFLELRDLVVDGAKDNGLNIDDSGHQDTPAIGVVLKNIVVRNVGPQGNRDGIKLSGVDDFRVEHCRVERWGAGGSAIDMVGCHRGVIEHCQFIGADSENANGVQTKGGSSEIVVRFSRFEKAGGRGVNLGGSTGKDYFRPRAAQYEAQDITVEDCEFLGGGASVAFVGVDGAVVRHNTIYRPRRWVFRILQETAEPGFVPCRNGQFAKNAVIFRSDELRQVANIGGGTRPETFTFAGNVWQCLDRDDARRLVQLPVAETDGVYDELLKLADAEQGDIRILERQPSDAGARANDSQE